MKTKFCPKCKSIEIEDITEKALGELMYFPYGSPRLYKCIKCGFTNAVFPEIEEKELKKFLKNKSTKNSVRKKEISQKPNNKPED